MNDFLIRILRALLRLLEHRRTIKHGDFYAALYIDDDFSIEDTSMLTIDLNTDGGAAHAATLACVNTDGSPAQNVAITYASDNNAAASVDASSGALTIVGVGVATITGTGTRGKFTHSDSGQVTVTQDANTGDFTATLALT